ncbi:MAG: EAL domain-containing protein [Sphingomonas fennica]
MAFQPIVDYRNGNIFAYEALVRGPEGEGAASVLSQVNDDNRYAFDQQCRVTAIRTAVEAGLLDGGAGLSINFLPNAVYSPRACIQLTLKTAREVGLPPDRLIFEFTENEQMADPAHVAAIIATYREMGFGTALDDFGAGHAGLALLARFHTDIIKLDMALIRDLAKGSRQRPILHAVKTMADGFGTQLIAEGVETADEAEALCSLGICLMQGYHFARPAFRRLVATSELAGIPA